MMSRFTWLLPIVILGISAWWWYGMSSETAALRLQRDASRRAHSSERTSEPSRDASASRVASDDPSTERSLAEERSRLAAIKTEIASLGARMPAMNPDEIVASYGKLQDIGRQAGSTVRAFASLLGALPMPDLKDHPEPFEKSAPLPDDDPRGPATELLMKRVLLLQGRVPEIRELEKSPDDIAAFQASALAEVFNLSSDATHLAKGHVRAAFADIAARRLTAADRPAANDTDWKEQRTEALQALMLNLRPLLPGKIDSFRERMMLTSIVNLGVGFEEEFKTDGHNVTFAWGMNWPQAPW